jgi:hypothetical protein
MMERSAHPIEVITALRAMVDRARAAAKTSTHAPAAAGPVDREGRRPVRDAKKMRRGLTLAELSVLLAEFEVSHQRNSPESGGSFTRVVKDGAPKVMQTTKGFCDGKVAARGDFIIDALETLGVSLAQFASRLKGHKR